jgi:hypothetical protein
MPCAASWSQSFPAQVLSAFGLGTPNEALIVSRDAGVTLIGVGIINWMARNATGAPLRGLLWGNIFMLVVDTAVNIWEIAAGMIPFGLAAASFVIPLVLVTVFALGLRSAEAR